MARQGNARPRRVRLGARWRSWRGHHSQSAAESLAKVIQQPVASFMTWLVLGIAIALPAGLWTLLDNVQAVSARLDSPSQLSVFLAGDISAEQARAFAGELLQRDDVVDIEFLDRTQALEEFVAASSLGDLASHLPANPLPHLLLVSPESDTASLLALQEHLTNSALVDEIVIDAQWLERLQALMALGRRGVQLLAILLLAAVVLVLGNTIRLEIESRREEIVIIKLVGGSNAFARRPLLYTGLWFGLGGGVVAALLVVIGIWLLSVPVSSLSRAYDSDFVLYGPGLVDSLQLVLIGAALGLIGAWMAVFRHLRAIEPR